MNIPSKIFCRTFQNCFRLAQPVLPYREPKIYNKVQDIIKILNENKLQSVLVITDTGLRLNGATATLEKLLEKHNINFAVYDATNANPTVRNVESARRLYTKQNCDCLIAFGGGSSIDCAKAVGARIAYPNKKLNQLKGLLKVRRKLPTLIAVPTTAGTGSEVTVTAVITDSDKKYKYTMNNFTMIPRYAILDPEVLYTLPQHLTATTGMDALTHAVEAYIGGSTNKETRRLSRQAVKLIFNNIETSYRDGKNYEARKNMLLASYKAGISFSKSYVGYIHAIAHSLGGQYNIPHGLANSVIMPYVLEDYGKAAHKKLHELGIAAGIANTNDTHEEGAKKFIRAIQKLNKDLNISEKIKGIKKEDIPKMAKHASKEANPLYPVPVLMNSKELEKFYYKVADWS